MCMLKVLGSREPNQTSEAHLYRLDCQHRRSLPTLSTLTRYAENVSGLHSLHVP